MYPLELPRATTFCRPFSPRLAALDSCNSFKAAEIFCVGCCCCAATIALIIAVKKEFASNAGGATGTEGATGVIVAGTMAVVGAVPTTGAMGVDAGTTTAFSVVERFVFDSCKELSFSLPCDVAMPAQTTDSFGVAAACGTAIDGRDFGRPCFRAFGASVPFFPTSRRVRAI